MDHSLSLSQVNDPVKKDPRKIARKYETFAVAFSLPSFSSLNYVYFSIGVMLALLMFVIPHLSSEAPRILNVWPFGRSQLELNSHGGKCNCVVGDRVWDAVLIIHKMGHLIRKPQRNVCVFLAPTCLRVVKELHSWNVWNKIWLTNQEGKSALQILETCEINSGLLIKKENQLGLQAEVHHLTLAGLQPHLWLTLRMSKRW
ncbi:hypothetical protein VNO77_24165 [Canavalia gladiata]|uniref:Uncharacterized protein n=1 Tax=Canavalia gladiata TaxID=3824 RepID=A0AAN9L5R3_CANGL